MKVNSREYMNRIYADPSWKAGYQGAYPRLDLIVNGLPRREKHLDIGCADGYFTARYLERYPDTEGYGVDISEVVVKDLGSNFTQGDIYNLSYPDNEFDLVHCGEVLEHLDDPEKALKEIARILKPGGRLVLTTPNYKAAKFGEHIQYWDPGEVEALVEKEFILKEANDTFFNEKLLYIEADKR